MLYHDVLTIALSILTSVITGGFVLIFVEVGNKKNRERDKYDLLMIPFMHKLTSYLRFVSWSRSHICYPKPVTGYNQEFKRLVDEIGRLGGMAITSGGDYNVDRFSAEQLADLAQKINNIWYYHDKMHPCDLTWKEYDSSDDFISKELKEINPMYLSLPHDVDMVSKVSSDFYTDVYQAVENDTYRHEAYLSQYQKNTIIVASSFIFTLSILGFVLFVELPVSVLQVLTMIVIFLLIICVMSLSIDVKTQIKWSNKLEQLKIMEKLKDYVKSFIGYMKKISAIIEDFLLSKMILGGLLLSVWSILCIELNLIPRIPTNMSTDTIDSLDKLFLALAYSFVAGAILYWVTSTLPFLQKKRKFRQIIVDKIHTLGNDLAIMNFEFRGYSTLLDVSDVDKVMALFDENSVEKWTKPSTLHSGLLVADAFQQDFNSICSLITQIIATYGTYLNAEQLICLEEIRDQKISSYIEWSRINKNEERGEFLKRSVVPCYRKMIESYNKLISISDIS